MTVARVRLQLLAMLDVWRLVLAGAAIYPRYLRTDYLVWHPGARIDVQH